MSRRSRRRGRTTKSTRAPGRSAAGPAAARSSGAAARPASGAGAASEAASRPPGRIIAPWWERFGGRLEWEIEALKAAGFEVCLGEECFERGRIQLQLNGSVGSEGDHRLTVVFPDTYPELRPEVYAPDLRLARHQNPFEFNLCLLDSNTRAWNPDETAAWLITERIPYLLALLRDPQRMGEQEVPQGEPIGAYLPRQPGAAIFVADTYPPVSASNGTLEIQLEGNATAARVRGLMASIRDAQDKEVARPHTRAAARFRGRRIRGRWHRLDGPPRTNDAAALLEALKEREPRLRVPLWERVGSGRVNIVGAVYPEEVAQGKVEDAWLVLVQVKGVGAYICHTESIGEQDFAARVPELSSLREAKVALFGVGTLGAPIAIQLAQSRVGQLRLIDGDTVDASTSVRWPLGLSAAGESKVAALQARIYDDFPHTEVLGAVVRIGRAGLLQPEISDNEVLSRVLTDATIMVDATAEIGLQQALSRICTDWGIPQIYVTATEGGWGGIVARCLPGRTGCWMCLRLRIDDGSIPVPAALPSRLIQPRGCRALTFTGAIFDMLPLSAQAARLVAQTLGGGPEDYPPSKADVFVFRVRSEDGVDEGPSWSSHPLLPHPSCDLCGGH